MVFIISVNFLLYNSSNEVIEGVGIENISYSHDTSWTEVTGMTNTYVRYCDPAVWITYFNLASSSINLSLTIDSLPQDTAHTPAYARPIISVSAVDIVTFDFQVEVDKTAGNTTSYTQVFDALSTAGKTTKRNNNGEVFEYYGQYLYWLRIITRLNYGFADANYPYFYMYAQSLGYNLSPS